MTSSFSSSRGGTSATTLRAPMGASDQFYRSMLFKPLRPHRFSLEFIDLGVVDYAKLVWFCSAIRIIVASVSIIIVLCKIFYFTLNAPVFIPRIIN